MFKIECDTGNASFYDEDNTFEPTFEAIRILDIIKNEIEFGASEGSVIDINGNKIGNWVLREE